MTADLMIFMDGKQLLGLMQDAADEPDREVAHRSADEIMCSALYLAAIGELDEIEARALLLAYRELDKWYG